MGGRHILLFHSINQLTLSILQRKSGSETEKYVTKKNKNIEHGLHRLTRILQKQQKQLR